MPLLCGLFLHLHTIQAQSQSERSSSSTGGVIADGAGSAAAASFESPFGSVAYDGEEDIRASYDEADTATNRARASSLAGRSKDERDTHTQVTMLGYSSEAVLLCMDRLQAEKHPGFANVNVILDHVEGVEAALKGAAVGGGGGKNTGGGPFPPSHRMEQYLQEFAASEIDSFPAKPSSLIHSLVAGPLAVTRAGSGGRAVRDMAQQLAERDTEIRALRLEVDDLKEARLCRICQERETNVTLGPCGHHCVCHVCFDEYKKLGNRTCVICRQPWSTSIRTYDG